MTDMPWKNSPPALAPRPTVPPLDMAKMAKDILTAPSNAAFQAPIAAPGHNFASLIDELGSVRADIKKLEKREEALADQVEALGPGEHDGTRCRAVVTEVLTNRLDTKSLAAVLPAELIAAHTKASVSVRVSIKPLV